MRWTSRPLCAFYVLTDADGFVTATEDNHDALQAEVLRANLSLPVTVRRWIRDREATWHLKEEFQWA